MSSVTTFNKENKMFKFLENKFLATMFWIGIGAWVLLFAGAFFAPYEKPAIFSRIHDKTEKLSNDQEFVEMIGWGNETWRNTHETSWWKFHLAVEMEDQTNTSSEYYVEGEYSRGSMIEFVYTYGTIMGNTYGCYAGAYFGAYKADFSYLEGGEWVEESHIKKWFRCGELYLPGYG